MALTALWGRFNIAYRDMDHCHPSFISLHSMTANLSLPQSSGSNFAFQTGTIISLCPGKNFFYTHVAGQLCMTWLDDDKTLKKDMLRCGDNVSLMGVMQTVDGGRAPIKGSCVPLPLQIDALKRSIEYRIAKQETVETIEIEKQEIPVQQPANQWVVGEKPRVTITDYACAQYIADWAARMQYTDQRAAGKAVMDIIRAAMRAGLKPE